MSYAQQVRYLITEGFFNPITRAVTLDFCFCEGPLLLAVIYKKQEVLRNVFSLGSSRGSMKLILTLNNDAIFFLNFFTITMTQKYTFIECGRFSHTQPNYIETNNSCVNVQL